MTTYFTTVPYWVFYLRYWELNNIGRLKSLWSITHANRMFRIDDDWYFYFHIQIVAFIVNTVEYWYWICLLSLCAVYSGYFIRQVIAFNGYEEGSKRYKEIILIDDGYVLKMIKKGSDSSVGKLSASQAGDSGSNPGGRLTWVTQSMNERWRDCQL